MIMAIGLAAVLSGCSLAEDVTPPPNYQSPTPEQQAVAVKPAYPAVAPDPSQGAAIYAEKCAPCHGQTGLGDGPQANQLPNPVAAIGSAQVARAAKPADWFNVVSQGRLDRYMPGFAGSLSEQQRWDVLAYVDSLSVVPGSLAQGQTVYEEKCAACHGPQGNGEGPQAASLTTPPTKFTDLQTMAGRAPQDLFQAVSSGAQPDMPAFAGQLSEDQRWAVVDYMRTLGYSSGILASNPPPAGPTVAATFPSEGTPKPTSPGAVSVNPQGTPQPNATAAGTPAGIVSVTGQITNGTGGSVPVGLTVTLHGFDSMQETYTKSTTSGVDGKYAFPVVEMPSGRVFMVSVDYKDATFNSDIAHSQQNGDTLSLPVTIYEPTTDASKVTIDRMHVFFDFSNAGFVQVVELYIASNAGNQTVVATAPGQPILKFALPKGATNLQFQQGSMGQQYVETADGFGDTQSIPPGSGTHQVLFAFEMPYQNQLDVSLPVTQAVQSAVIMVPKGNVSLKSSQLSDSGERDVQGVTFRLYTADQLKANSSIALSLSGNPNAPAKTNLISGVNTPAMIIGLGVFALALIGAGLWLYQTRRMAPARSAAPAELEAAEEDHPAGDPDSLIDAIAALDDLFQAGKLPEAAYRERRAELKARLAEALK